MTVLLWKMPSEGYGTYLVLVVLVLSILLALFLLSFIIGLVVYVLLPCLTLDLLFALILLTVLTPVVQTLLVMYGTTHCKSSSDHIAIGNLLTEIPLYSHFHPSFQPQWTRSNCISCCMFTILYTPIFAPYINSRCILIMAISEDDCQIHTLKTAPGQPLLASQKCHQESPQHL